MILAPKIPKVLILILKTLILITLSGLISTTFLRKHLLQNTIKQSPSPNFFSHQNYSHSSNVTSKTTFFMEPPMAIAVGNDCHHWYKNLVLESG